MSIIDVIKMPYRGKNRRYEWCVKDDDVYRCQKMSYIDKKLMHVKVAMLKFIVNSQNLIDWKMHIKFIEGLKSRYMHFECKFECKDEFEVCIDDIDSL